MDFLKDILGICALLGWVVIGIAIIYGIVWVVTQSLDWLGI